MSFKWASLVIKRKANIYIYTHTQKRTLQEKFEHLREPLITQKSNLEFISALNCLL